MLLFCLLYVCMYVCMYMRVACFASLVRVAIVPSVSHVVLKKIVLSCCFLCRYSVSLFFVPLVSVFTVVFVLGVALSLFHLFSSDNPVTLPPIGT